MHAPKLRTNRSADKARSFAAAFANTTLDDLATGSMPQFAPQQMEFHNANAAAQTANMVLEDGTAFSLVIPGGQVRIVRVPVQEILATSGDDISAIAYWWEFPQLDEPQAIYDRGPA